MKVLEKGEPHKWSLETRCTGKGNNIPGCNALLLIEEEDLFNTYNSWMDGSSETYTTFRCPECKVLTDIPSVPYYVKVREKE